MLKLQTLAMMYETYAKMPGPVSVLADATSLEALRAVDQSGLRKASAPNSTRMDRMVGTALRDAQLFAQFPVRAFMVEEIIFGTGRNPTKALNMSSKEGIDRHFKDCLQNPTTTGLCGLTLGILVAVPTAKGAVIGGALGALIGLVNHFSNNVLDVRNGVRHGTIEPAAVGGAMVGAALGCLAAASAFIAISTVRLAFALLKVLCMAPFALTGALVGGVRGLAGGRETVAPGPTSPPQMQELDAPSSSTTMGLAFAPTQLHTI